MSQKSGQQTGEETFAHFYTRLCEPITFSVRRFS